MRYAGAIAGAFLLWCGCVPEDERRLSLVSEPRILAVLSDRAEGEPGAAVHYRALAVDGAGPRDAQGLRWSYCVTPRALTENTPVSMACAEAAERPLVQRGVEIDATLPQDGCARFGSQTSLGLRPLDPDSTGGYYQPLRLADGELPLTVVRQRILCPLANASIDVAQRFARSYLPNTHPGLNGLVLRAKGVEVGPNELSGDTSVELILRLQEDARESYPIYDSRSGKLATRVESLTVQWFVTGGELAYDATEVRGLSTSNRLATPAGARDVWLWIVVRDERGGVSALTQLLRATESLEAERREPALARKLLWEPRRLIQEED